MIGPRIASTCSLVLGLLVTPISLADTVDEALERLARSQGQGAPLMRIGLEPAHAVEVSGDRPYRAVDPSTGKDVWLDRYEGRLRIVADGGPTGEVPVLYRVQVGAFGSAEAAERERQRLERETGSTAVVRHDPDRGSWRVRVGESRDRLTLTPLIDRLRQLGVADAWIAEEPAQPSEAVSLRLVDDSYRSQGTELRRLVLLPSRGGRVKVEGVSYRGIIELRITDFGTVRPINWIELENYLLGVVPRELGPEVWPQLEALKAQSVAARTYAWRNRGQFADEGFDLCATPRCQVYGGATAEHPLSDRAVAATRGEILLSEGRPIRAYYTATCGGHTENAEDIFLGENEPYLRGVPCRAEEAALSSLRGVLTGRKTWPLLDETGVDVTRDWVLLQALGVIDAERVEPKRALRPISPQRLREWTLALARRAGLAEPAGPLGATDSLGKTAASLVADLGWDDRARVLLAESDLPALLRGEKAIRLPEPQRRAVAYLAWSEALRPHPDGLFRVGQQPSEGRVAGILARVAETYDAFRLRSGVVSGVGNRSVRIVQGKGETRVELADQPWLFGLTAGRPVPKDRLEVWPGDRIRFRRGASGTIDFLELTPPVKGTSDDRTARVYSWEERMTRRELEAAINERLSVGRVRDLQIVRRGVSGRVVELRVIGSGGTADVRGFDVRRLLGLRESLIVIEIQRDRAGAIEAVVFAGKGWGHGIGLCQVGAYGMALRGADYREILTHYYTGARIAAIGRSGR